MPATEPTIAVNDELAFMANELELESAEDVLRWALREFGPDVALATGFGAEGCVLIRMLSEIDRNARIGLFSNQIGRSAMSISSPPR